MATRDIPLVSAAGILSVGSITEPDRDQPFVTSDGRLLVLEVETAGLLSRFTTKPTPARTELINSLVKQLKVSGIWTKLDALYLMAAADAQAAQRNWIADAYNLTPVSSPTFTADRGYAGDGISSYLRTGFVPSTAAGEFALNSAHLGAWSRTDNQSNGALIGARVSFASKNSSIIPRDASNLSYVAVNFAGAGSYTVANSLGHFVANRSGASAQQGYQNGVSGTSTSAASDAITDLEVYGLALNQAGSAAARTNRQVAAMHIGGSLTAQNVADLYAALTTYMQGVGAA